MTHHNGTYVIYDGDAEQVELPMVPWPSGDMAIAAAILLGKRYDGEYRWRLADTATREVVDPGRSLPDDWREWELVGIGSIV